MSALRMAHKEASRVINSSNEFDKKEITGLARKAVLEALEKIRLAFSSGCAL